MLAFLQSTVTITWEAIGVMALLVSGLFTLALHFLRMSLAASLLEFKVELLEELDKRYVRKPD